MLLLCYTHMLMEGIHSILMKDIPHYPKRLVPRPLLCCHIHENALQLAWKVSVAIWTLMSFI